MFLKSEHFSGRFEKIAQSILSSSSGKSSSFGSSNGLSNNSYGGRGVKTLQLDNTLSKAREKADLQPLHKDSTIIKTPKDQPTAMKMNDKQDYLGNIEDKRITFNHLRSR